MNKVKRYILIALGVGVLVSSLSVKQVAAQNVIGEILKRMDAHNKALQSVQANVTMVKTDSTLGVSDTYTGTTSYVTKTNSHPMYARIDWLTGQDGQISVNGDDFEMYSKGTNVVYYGKAQKAREGGKVGNMLMFMNMPKDELKTNYIIAYLGEEQISGGIKTWHLQLTPKAATGYRSSEVWVDGDGMPRQAKIIEKNNDSTTVLLSNIKKNLTLNKAIFKLKYPGTAKRQQV